MRILFLSDDFLPDSDIVGGAGIVTFRLAQKFKSLGHDVFAVTATKDKAKSGIFLIEGINVYRLHTKYYSDRWRAFRSVYNPGVIPELKKILYQVKPDIVHAHTIHLYLSYQSLVVAKYFAKKVFLTAHDIMPVYQGTFTDFIDPSKPLCPTTFDYLVSPLKAFTRFRFRFNPFRNMFIRRRLSAIDGVITVSDALRDALSQNGVVVKKTIHNGIEGENWLVSDGYVSEFKNKYKFQGSEVVLFGGRLSGAKGGNLILQAMRDVVHVNPNSKLVVVGRIDEYAKRMMAQAQKLGISKSIIFVGWLVESEMKSAYTAASVVVVPSVCFDSFPNSNLEAFAASKPVVATCFGGSREIVKDGENGFIVNPFDVKRLASLISSLLVEKEKAKKFGENGKQLVTKEFSMKKMAEAYLELFQSRDVA